MERKSDKYRSYVEILRRELVVAMGCTEPIAVAYCAAVAREALGVTPERVEILASGNIIKNVKSVIIPHSGGLRGISVAAALGVFYGRADSALEVISHVSADEERELVRLMDALEFRLVPSESDRALDITVTVYSGEDSASARILDEHTNIVSVNRNGEELSIPRAASCASAAIDETDFQLLDVAGAFDFALSADLDDVRDIIERQIEYNSAISREGLSGSYGASIGKLVMRRGDDARNRAIAYAAAGSDARMSGCDMPVVINSGSGNQGMTASLPVIAYAEYYGKSREELLRALLLSNLVTLHLKSGIGRLSAYCGAVSAGAGAGAGIAFLMTGDPRTVNHTVVNALAISSGIVCDGAKSSCAAKIAMAVDAGIMGYEMHICGNQFYGGDGLVSKGVENTIRNISALGNEGMKETDRKIIEIMTGC